MEKKAEFVSTSEDGQLKALSQPSPKMQKRLIKKPRFHDDMDDDSK